MIECGGSGISDFQGLVKKGGTDSACTTSFSLSLWTCALGTLSHYVRSSATLRFCWRDHDERAGVVRGEREMMEEAPVLVSASLWVWELLDGA